MGTLLAPSGAKNLHLEIIHVPLLRPFTWLRLGWLDARRHWGASLGYGALIVALGWTTLIFCGTHPYFVAAAVTGFLLVGPLMSAGLCEMSRRYCLGLSASFDESMDGFTRNATALFEFGAVLAAIALVWFSISGIMLADVFQIQMPDIRDTLYRGFFDSTNRMQVLAYAIIGAVLAGGVFAVSVVAIPLIIDRHASVGQAMRASLEAVLHNIPAMMLWSALILVLTLIGYAPLLAGMLLIVPLLGHATWYAYRDMVR